LTGQPRAAILRCLATDSFRDSDGRTPLHYAALNADAQGLEDGLRAGINPDEADGEGFTALHFAAQNHSVAEARLLLEAGATVDQVNKFGNSPLFTAVFNSKGSGEMIVLLREWGADPFLVNNYGKTPLELARMIANFDTAQFFGDLA
jgi:uncharacterized protein